MFRIDQDTGENRIRLSLSGEVSEACSEVLEACCNRARKEGKAVELVLDLTTIDESGRALLMRLARKGVRISAKGMYHAYLVDTIRHEANRGLESRLPFK